MLRCQISDGSAHRDPERWIRSLDLTADFIQIREPELTARQLTMIVRELAPKARILVNDRIDVALATYAAGVHLRGNSISPKQVRAITPPGFLITVACHSEDDVMHAEGADYAVLAPIFQPLSKTDSRTPLGLDVLERIARRAPLPILALGGITLANAPLCTRAGAAGVAGISLFRRS
jgi:thiamine-phosphate pyrophosphorylase